MSVAAKLNVSLEFSQTETAVLGQSPSWASSISLVQQFTDGTTANKVDLIYAGERTVASSTNDDIDVAGSLTDQFGNTITMAEIVGIIVINKQKDGTANTTDLTIGGGSNTLPGFSSAVGTIGPGGMFIIMTPDAGGQETVTAGTGDILRIANGSGASNTYQITILGRSA